MLGDHILHQHVASGGGDGSHIGARLDLVRNDGIGAAPERVHPPDLHRIRARAGDPGTHGVEEVGQVHDMGLLGCVFNHGLAGKQGSRHHDIDGSAHACHIQADPGPVESLFPGLQGDILLRLVHIGTQGLKSLDVLIDGPGGKIAASGKGHMGMTETTQQSTHQVVAGPHLFYKLRVWGRTLDLGAVQLDYVRLRIAKLHSHTLQDVQKDPDIRYIRYVFNAADSSDQQRSRQNGNRRVFRAADGDGPHQGIAAVNFISGQGMILSL